MAIEIAVLVVLLVLSALFSSAETAFLSLGRVQLEHQVREGVPGAARVSALLSTPRRLLSAILVGNNLVNTGAAAVGTVLAAEIVSDGAGVVAATLIVTILLVVFGEVGPMTIALHHSFRLSRLYALPLQGWAVLIRPAVSVLDGISRTLLGLIGEGGSERQTLSAGELRTAIRIGAEVGAIEEDQSTMLLGALDLEQTQVRRIMTPRVNMIAAEADEGLEAVASRLSEAGFLRLPVVSGSPDNVVGYIHVRDVAAAYAEGRREIEAREIMREAPFESEAASVARAFNTMRETGAQLLILIDEYGSTSGLVTLEDISEEVLGRIQSESGPQGEDIPVRIGGKLYVEGNRSLSDLDEELGLKLTHPDADTVAGLVLALLRRIPEVNAEAEYEGYRFTVKAADERRISLVAIDPLPANDTSRGALSGPSTRA